MNFLQRYFHSFNPAEPGFFFMWILLFTGVCSLAIAIERIIFLMRYSGGNKEDFMKKILSLITENNSEKAIQECDKKGKMALAHVVKAGLQETKSGADRIRNTIDETVLKIVPLLENRTGYLATIGNISTLIGLMGTIYGLILSFAAVGKPGIDPAEKSTLLAQGIAAAMNTTFTGLLIAIPTMVLFAVLRGKTQKLIDEIDEYSLRLVNSLVEQSYKTHKYHISAGQLKEGVGLHVTHNNIKIFTDNKLVKEINV